ncbi:hypothetical protein [Planomicrobium sp. Y74]|uniref:hypothetical protein n=1 Tax=Planomicrobium sp. Y74 TaxID=2478977 RepID=UPI000EF542C3|nr:hypothetical protein [Planomicrobium sp. Y74]RLQ84879.1 hypothetical protein D9754_16525 [Planomicrobium sp. Y74]
MARCIYYKDRDDLRFDKQEHIIPAGLGGKQMLEKGVVSDEANENFSKTELRVLRDSLIGLNRMNNGPGKRGSLKVKKVKTPTVTVLRSDLNNDKIDSLLGFIFMGKSFVIPQLTTYWEEYSLSYQYVALNLDIPSVELFQIEMNEKTIQFLESKKRNYRPVHVPFTTDKNFVHIGYYKNNWYVATSFKKRLNVDVMAVDLLPVLYELREKLKNEKNSFKPEFMDEVVFKFENRLDMNFSDMGFLYLKTAFNTLAFFKGSKYVMHPSFDEVRETVLTVGESGKFIRLKDDLEHPDIESYIESFPDKAHYVILFSEDRNINAYVSFYREKPVVVKLGNNYEGEPFIDGLVCDWQNTEETRLEQWIK